MAIDVLSNSELTRLVNQLLMGKGVSWSNYDRFAIADIYKTNPYIFSITNKLARAGKNINLIYGNYVDGEFQENKNSKLAKVINNPSSALSRDEFTETVIISYYNYGECFIYFQRYEAGNNKGEIIPKSIQVSPPQLVDIQHENGVVTGYVINGDTTKAISVDNMIHIKSFNPDYTDLHGLPYLAVASRLIVKLDAADETETKTYQNGGPSFLVTPNNAGDVEETVFGNFISHIRKIWTKKENQKGVAGINIPVKIERIGQNPADMGVTVSQKRAMESLLVLWGLDPGLFSTEASTYNNKAVMERAVYTEAAIPFLKKLINKLNDVFEPIYKERIELDTSDIEVLQPNYRDKAEWMTLAGVFTDNEIRTATSFDKRETPESDLTPNENLTNSATEGFDKETLKTEIIDN